jgi:hypothetical protein
MGTVRIASISIMALLATSVAVDATAGQSDKVSRPPSELLRRLPSSPAAIQKAADKVVESRPRQPYVLGGMAGTRGSSTRGSRPAPTVTQAGGRAAAATGSSALSGAARVGRSLAVYGAVEVARQEIERPGKTMRDLSTGQINPDRNEVAGAIGGGAVSAGAVAIGVATGPAIVAGATTAGTLAVIDQESRDPGKTVRDINRMARDADRELQKAGKAIGDALGGLFGRRP